MSSPSSKNTKVVSCYCNWPECENYHSLILAEAPAGHFWRLPPIRIQFKEKDPSKMTISKSAFWQSIVRHLRSGEKFSSSPSELFIYPHHFPSSFWEWNVKQPMNKNICTPLSKSDAAMVSRHDLSHDRFSTVTNSILVLHSRSLSRQQSTLLPAWSDKYKVMYAKSPFVSRNEVSTYTQSLTSGSNKPPKHMSSTISLEMQLQNKEAVTLITEPSSIPTGIENENCIIPNEVTSQSTSYIVPESSTLLTPCNIFLAKSKYYDTMKILYEEAKGNTAVFKTNESVIMISKLLSKVYDDSSPFELSYEGMTYYPCINGVGITKNDTCELYSIRKHNTGRDMLCSSCQQQQTTKLRNRNRLVLTPSRKRPYTAMSPIELLASYSTAQK